MTNSGARFTDIDLSDQPLPACFGYLTRKIQPLTEVFKDLETTLPRIDDFIKLARKHCKYPNNHNLTKDESATLYLYTMEMGDNAGIYQILNETLRLEDRSQVHPWFGYLKLFHTAATKLTIFRGIVWRGVNIDLSKQFKKNQIITWWSISSCSKSITVIKGFLGNAGNGTLFNIECRNGRCISEFTCYPQENEVILMPGTKLQVVDNPLDHLGLHIIHLREIHDDEEGEGEGIYFTSQGEGEGEGIYFTSQGEGEGEAI